MTGFTTSRRLMLAVVSAWVATLALPATAQTVRQITDDKTTLSGPGALDDAGSVVLCGASGDPLGTNPDHAYEIFSFDPVTALPVQLTSNAGGTSAAVSVSDDGQWIVFPSPRDLLGLNHDESSELFVMTAAGTVVSQLTNDPAPNAGSVSLAVISGDGSRIAFVANTDPLGTNPDNLDQLFIINRDGTALAQLTQMTEGAFGGVSISDDATRIAFAHSGDPTGGNADLGSEVFAINADGTMLRQLTSSPLDTGSGGPSLSGNGQKIAFQSNADPTGGNAANQDEIFVIDWDGTGLAQLTTTQLIFGLTGDPASQSPSITDDGVTVAYQSNHSTLFPPVNIDGNYEIFTIRTDGTGRTPITGTLLQAGSFFPTISGGGGRITYYGVGLAISLKVMDGTGGNQRDLLTFDLVFVQQPDLSPDGSRIVFTRSEGLFGGSDVWRIESDGTGLAQVTTVGASDPSIAADNSTIVLSSESNPDGTSNSDLSEEIFTVQADGSGLTQLTSGAAGTSSQNPVIAAQSDLVVFDSDADLTGGNPDASREIFRVLLSGAGVVQLTNGPVGTTSRFPRVDGSGTWIVFESDADFDGSNADASFEVYRIRSDGTALERITGDPLLGSGGADISAAGDRIVFSSQSNPLGTNPEENGEVYHYDPATTTLSQLTSSATGSSGGARFAAGGGWVYFSSTAPIFEDDPDGPLDLYRIPPSGGMIERVGALRTGVPGAGGLLGGGLGGGTDPDDTGQVAVFSGIGDFTGDNPDQISELWVIDRDALPEFDVGRPSPTVLSWTPNSGPVRYDVIRGDVANLVEAAGTVDLGPVVCLEDDSPDADTIGYGDPSDPVPGQAFFFVYRGSQGLLDGPGSYGASTAGSERVAAFGDCTTSP